MLLFALEACLLVPTGMDLLFMLLQLSKVC